MTFTALIVDDEPANIDLIKNVLPSDIKVKAALKGEIAIKLFEKSVPSVIFMDLVMPGLNGFETLERIRALPQGDSVPVVIVSGNCSPEDKIQSENLGVIEHLIKPVKPEQIIEVVKTLQKGS